jgi:hypothetical protein
MSIPLPFLIVRIILFLHDCAREGERERQPGGQFRRAL